MALRSGHGEPVDIEPIPVPYGWQRWTAGAVEVPVDDGLRLGNGPVHHARTNDRARLELPPAVDGLFSPDHDQVLSSRPVVRLPDGSDAAVWSVTVLDDHGRLVREIRPIGRVVDPFAAQTPPVVGTFTVKVRGPLGRGITRRFTVAEGAAVTFSPRHRGLRFRGGLDSCIATVRCGTDSFECVLGASDIATTVPIHGVELVVEPPHTDVALLLDGGQPQFGIDVSSLVPARSQTPPSLCVTQARSAQARVRHVVGHTDRPAHRATGHAHLPPASVQRLCQRCWLGAFRCYSASGECWSPVSGRPRWPGTSRTTTVRCWSTRPSVVTWKWSLTDWRAVGASRRARSPRAAELLSRLRSAGPLRVQVRERNDWVPEPVDALPTPGRDVFDLSKLAWSLQTEASPYPGLIAFLLREPTARPESASFPRIWTSSRHCLCCPTGWPVRTLCTDCSAVDRSTPSTQSGPARRMRTS